MAFGGFGVEISVPDPGDDVVLAAGLRGEWHDLGSGKVGGKPDTGSVFPGIFAQADDTFLGWLELEARYDTRDSQRQPYRGFVVGVGVHSSMRPPESCIAGR